MSCASQRRTLNDLEKLGISGKRVLLRVDFNLPVIDGKIAAWERVDTVLASVGRLQAMGAHVIMLSHFGRPGGKAEPAFSFAPLVDSIAHRMGAEVHFATDMENPPPVSAPLTLLENCRFHPGDESNDADFAQLLARWGDVFVFDAFSVAHRRHASTIGVAHFLPAYAGDALEKELAILEKLLSTPEQPFLAIIGGKKIESKIAPLAALARRATAIAIGGAMAAPFLSGNAFVAPVAARAMADALKQTARLSGCKLLLPVDGAFSTKPGPAAKRQICSVRTPPAGEYMYDIGDKTCEEWTDSIEKAATILWNGPLGVYEQPPFDVGTRAIVERVAARCCAGDACAIAGGGDSAAALQRLGIKGFSHVSTGGGAFLAWLENPLLPALEHLVIKGGRRARNGA